MEVIILKDELEIGKIVGDLILDLVKKKSKTVLGLATGSSPESTYAHIIKESKLRDVDWSDVRTFNLDEYMGLKPENDQSYRYYMNEKLFNHINIKKENTFIPSGFVKNNSEAREYDTKIKNAGGIDLQLLGIGINGHIGFNEPGTSFDSLTSIVDLTQSTIDANSRNFENIDDVPKQAVSMGLKSIMSAKKIILVAMGKNKAEAVASLVKGEISVDWPCTILQNHPDLSVVIDEEAASLLTKINE